MDTIRIVKELLDTNYFLTPEFKKYGKCYLFTTENLTGIFNCIDVTDKNITTVAGSGDQYLNAYLLGASHVLIFDINPLTLPLVELKVASLINLEYPDFCNFFIDGEDTFNKNTFNKLFKYLSDNTAAYYDFLLTHYPPKEIIKRTMHNFSPSLQKLKSINPYMEPENYYKLKEILQGKEIDFIESDLTSLPINLNEKQDAIFLSNISDSIARIWSINILKCYKRFIHVLSHNLNPKGQIQAGYIYNSYKTQVDYPIFANKEKRQAIFTSPEFSEHEVESYESYGTKDIVVNFHKKR